MSATVIVNLIGNDASLQAALKRTQVGAGAAQSALTRIGRAGGDITRVGRMATHGLTVPVLAVGVAAGKMAYDFDASMNHISTLVGASEKQMDQYRKGVLLMAQETGRAPKELADSLYFVTSSGFSGAKALKILRASAKAAATGLGDTATVADVVTSALKAYEGTNLTAAKTVDILNVAIKDGKAEPEQFAKEIGKVIAPAALLHVSFDQVAASVAAMSLKGQDAATATTSLRQIFVNFLKPASQTEKMMKKIGTSSAEMRKEIASKGLLPALKHLNDLAKKSGNAKAQATIGRLFPNVRALTGDLALVNGQGKTVETVFKDVKNSTGAADKSFLHWQQTIQGKFQTAIATLKTDLITLGGKLLPKVAEWLHRTVMFFHQLDPATARTIAKYVLLAAAIGPVLLVVGKLLTVFSLIARHPVITVIALLAVYFAKLYVENEKFRNGVNAVARTLGTVAGFLAKHRKAIIAILAPMAAFALTIKLVKAGMIAWRIATSGVLNPLVWLTRAQWAFNAAMAANPAVLITAAIVAVGVAVVICYKKFDAFRYVVNRVIKAIVTTILTMADVWLLVWKSIFFVLGKLPGKFGAPFRKAGQAIDTARGKVEELKKKVSDLPTSKTMEIRLNTEAAIKKLGQFQFDLNQVASEKQMHLAGPHVDGARAAGGPVKAGKTYLVGEKGPEILTMAASGNVTPNNQLGKGISDADAGVTRNAPSDKLTGLTKTYTTQQQQADDAARKYRQTVAKIHATLKLSLAEKHAIQVAEDRLASAHTAKQRAAAQKAYDYAIARAKASQKLTVSQKATLANSKKTMEEQAAQAKVAQDAMNKQAKAEDAVNARRRAGKALLGLAGLFTSGVKGEARGPISAAATALADSITKQFADADGAVPVAVQASIDKLNELASQAQNFRSSFVASMTDSSNFVSQFSGTTATTGDVKGFLTNQVSKIQRLGADLKTLTARGLPPDMLKQLAAGGLDALPMADALARSSNSDFAQILGLQKKIDSLTSSLGNTTENAAFGGDSALAGKTVSGTVTPGATDAKQININVTANTNANPAQIAHEVAWKLKTASA